MKTITSSEAQKNFGAVIDYATTGESIRVTRNGRRGVYVIAENEASNEMVRKCGVSPTTCGAMRFAYWRPTDCGLRALDAGAKLLVSGDKRHLLSMNPYRGIALIGIREFIDTYQSYT